MKRDENLIEKISRLLRARGCCVSQSKLEREIERESKRAARRLAQSFRRLLAR